MKTNVSKMSKKIAGYAIAILAILGGFSSCDNEEPSMPLVTVNVETAGTLPTLISLNDKYEITDLALTGNLNGIDIRFIREMAGSDAEGKKTNGKLSTLDLSGTNIVEDNDENNYYLYYDPTNNDEHDGVAYYSVDNVIGDYMFFDCGKLKSVTFAENITEIGNQAFYNCTKLAAIVIPNSVTSIKSWSFSNCESLASVTIGNSVALIGYNAFHSCTALTSVTIPNSITEIDPFAFDDCTGLTEIIVTSDNGCYSSLEGVLFDKNKTELVCFPIAKAATSYAIPNSVVNVGNYAFSNCIKLTSVTMPNSVVKIGLGSFFCCKGLTSVTIGNNVAEIESGAFSSCSALKSVTIPGSVTTIGQSAFYYCIGLKEIYSENSVPPVCTVDAFNMVSKTDCKVYVPVGSKTAYSTASEWKAFKTIVEK